MNRIYGVTFLMVNFLLSANASSSSLQEEDNNNGGKAAAPRPPHDKDDSDLKSFCVVS